MKRIKVIESGPMYLKDGEEYWVIREGKILHFLHSNRECCTYERVNIWNNLLESGRVKVEVQP